MPEGGWSSINAKVDNHEYYVPSGSNNEFTSRAKMVVDSSAGATSIPYVTLGNVVDSNNTTFSSWNDISMVYDGTKWNDGFGLGCCWFC